MELVHLKCNTQDVSILHRHRSSMASAWRRCSVMSSLTPAPHVKSSTAVLKSIVNARST